MPTEEELQGGFNLGDWEILPGHRELRRGDEVRRPEPKQFDLLMALAKRDTNAVTKQELIDEVWDGRATADEPITRCVSQLRQHLDDRETPHKLIETMQRRGYRLKQSIVLHHPAETEEPLSNAAESGSNPRLWNKATALMAIGFVAIIAYLLTNWIIDPPPPAPPEGSIAVLSFENLSGQQADEYMAAGFQLALVQALHGMEDYQVKIGPKDIGKEPQEIALLMDVESVLFGAMQKNGSQLRVNYVILTAGEVAFSGNVDGTAGDLFALQLDLANMVGSDLGDKLLPELIKTYRPDTVAYDSYMRGMFALEHRGDIGKLEDAIELFKGAIELDPNYGPSYLALATAYSLLPTYWDAPPEEMDRLALQTIKDGVAVDPTMEDVAGAIYGYVYHKQKRWKKSEAAFLQAINADVVDPNAFNWYSRMLASVGRLDESLAIALAGLEIEPSSTFLNSRVAMSYAWLGENQKAVEYYEYANAFGWTGETHNLGYAFILMQTGQIQKARDLARSAAQKAGRSTDWVAPVFEAFADPDPIQASAGLAALNKVSAVETINPRVEITVRTILGDLDGAMRIAKLLEQPGEIFEMDMLFIPQLKALRRHPDFMPLMDKLGITGYWQSEGCTWDSDQVSC
jgi:DNA-binding winged helix-turn-helix (wHTH) protein/tetratricopeptide (TPR) repeat protein